MTKPRVLLIAEAANPEWVSVPLVGWSLASALREVADVHIVTQVRNREAILRSGLKEAKDFTVIDSETLARPMWKLGEVLRMGEGKGWTALQTVSALSYPYFEYLIWKRFGSAIKAGEFDIVHRVTPLSPTIQSPIARKCKRAGVPFVIGPLNGGVPWPKAFDAERRREKEWLSYLRSAYKLLPGRASTLAANAIIVGSRHTQSEIPETHQTRCVYIPENAINPERFSRQASHKADPLRACFIGRMVPYKGPDMLLEAAIPLLQERSLELDFIGDGPLLPTLRSMADQAGLGASVRFHGWLQHDEVQTVAANCSVLSFPSIREFGGGVVLEAMALGLVPLIVDYAGPGELVTSEFGIKIPIGSRAHIVNSFREELARLATCQEKRVAMGEAGRARVASHFTWQAKAQQVSSVYDWVLGQRSEKPEPF